MADPATEIPPAAPPVAASAPAPEVAPQTAAEATPSAPVSEAVTQAAAVPTPEAPKTEAPAQTEPKPSLLSEPAKPAEEAPKAEAPAPVEEKPLPKFEAFTLPEGVKLDEAPLGKFSELLGKFELDGGVDHAKAQQFGQELVSFYVSEQNRFIQAQQDSWTKTREGWRDAFTTDRDIGGNRQEATLQRCKAMIDQYGGTKEQRAEIASVLSLTGAGDHPAIIRLLSNIGKALGEGKPVPAIVPKSPVPASKATRRYSTANTLNGAG